MKWETGSTEIQGGGRYPAVVVEAVEEESKRGNPQIRLELEVTVGTRVYNLRDWITPAYPPKLAHFCASAGIDPSVDDRHNKLDAFECLEKEVTAVMSEEKNDRGYYQIADYEPPAKEAYVEKIQGARPIPESQKTEGDIPF